MPEEDLVRFALAELETLGFRLSPYLIQGLAVRVPCAYPLYHNGYRETVGTLRRYLEGFSNLLVLGRAGLFRYNNSDHALLTGLYGARNILGKGRYDLWSIDPDGDS
jgi:protoporphyrinogen oxidase